MAPGYDRTVRKIVATRSGPGTAETIYVDEYGTTWQTQIGPVADQTCTPTVGRVEGGYILTGKRR